MNKAVAESGEPMGKAMGRARITLGLIGMLLASEPVLGQTPGVTPTEIRIGNSVPYTGPAAAYGTFGRTLDAFFSMINDQGGINGRLIRFISYDDGYSPPRALEQARRLVERDDVLLMFDNIGTGTNLAIRDYLNEAGVPHLFLAAGAETFDDPAAYPWTMRWNGGYRAEGEVYARYIAATHPGARIGVLYQNDAFGLDYLNGLRDGLDPRWEIEALPYEPGDANVDAQVAQLAAVGAEVFVMFALPRVTAQAIARAAEIGWRPRQIQGNVSASVPDVMIPAGVENGIGNVTAVYTKDPGYSGWAGSPDIVLFHAFMEQYFPEGDPRGVFESSAYAAGWALVEVLRRCGDNLSRENVLRQAESFRDFVVPNLLPGIVLNTSPTDHAPIEQFFLARFDGVAFVPFGNLIDLGN